MYYRWNSYADFSAWHNTVCAGLGIPHPNRNEASGEIDDDAQWTTAYTEAVEVAADDWQAYVEDDIATQYPDGLGTPVVETMIEL
jgi:hypothetical protein